MSTAEEWDFFNIGLVVTGEGEEQFLPGFLRSLTNSGHCRFFVLRRIGQLSPRSQKRRQHMVGKGQRISTRGEELALTVRGFLQQDSSNLVVVVDDLERRRKIYRPVYDTYRIPLDEILRPRQWQHRASVHFFVPMIEAYYFADSNAVNCALGLAIVDCQGDPESIRGPKGNLKKLCKEMSKNFDAKVDGAKIVNRIDLEKVLSNPNSCASLRSLFKWCSRRIGEPDSDRFQLLKGKTCQVTSRQIPADDEQSQLK